MIGISVLIVLVPVFCKFPQIKNYEIILSLLLIIIIGRIFHIVGERLSWQSIRQIANPRVEGISFYGVLIGIIIVSWWITKRNKINLINWFDTIALYLPIAQAVGRLGNFFNQELYGYPTNLPWKIYISTENRIPELLSYEFFHPTFFYESVLNLILFILLFFYRKKGKIAAKYAIGYGLIRLFVGRFRIDNVAVIGFLGWADIFSIAMITTGIILLIKHGKSRHN